MKTYLITPGGSGTNYLYQVFGKSYLTGGGELANPHQRFAQVFSLTDTRVLYIAAHPLNILLSFERRFFKELHLSESVVINVQGDYSTWARAMTRHGKSKLAPRSLDDYAHFGKNCFDFWAHYANWATYCSVNGIPFMFVKYESIGDNINKVENFVARRARGFEFRERMSDYKTNNRKELIAKLAEIHSGDIQFFMGLNNVIYHDAG